MITVLIRVTHGSRSSGGHPQRPRSGGCRRPRRRCHHPRGDAQMSLLPAWRRPRARRWSSRRLSPGEEAAQRRPPAGCSASRTATCRRRAGSGCLIGSSASAASDIAARGSGGGGSVAAIRARRGRLGSHHRQGRRSGAADFVAGSAKSGPACTVAAYDRARSSLRLTGLRRFMCSSSLGMISTKLQGRWR